MMSRVPDVAAMLPLKPVELELLLALVDDERHGYALVQQIAARTDGLVQLEPGNLYRIIKRLLAGGLVQESARRATNEDGTERRRYYKLTAHGSRVVQAELHRIRALLASAPARVLLRRLA
jgi:DNA-binding PadR family transcriptional regulator